MALSPDHSFNSVTTNNSANASTPDPNGAPGSTTFYWTDGWYMTIAVVTGILTANTRIGPYIFGILSIALIYQITLTLEGK